MKQNENRQIPFFIAATCIISLLVSYITVPGGYGYYSDIFISPVGMQITESYGSVPFFISKGTPGYYANGIYSVYNSWPPLNFLVLAQWQELVGHDVISSRWLYIIIKLLTDLLFFSILLRLISRPLVAFCTTLIFLLLPYRLVYSLLIFSDSWILFFYLLITALLIKVYKNKSLDKPRAIFAIGLLTGIGTLFSWQVFFILPAILIYYSWQEKKINIRWWIAGSLPPLLLICPWLVWIYYHPVCGLTAGNLFSDNASTAINTDQSAFHELIKKSWWGFFQSPGYQGIVLLKRVAKTLLEYSPVLLILLYNKWKGPTKPKPDHNLVTNIIRVHSLAMLFYLLILPMMFAWHEHQIPLFSLLAMFILAKELLRTHKIILFTILTCLCQLAVYYFIIPLLHSENKTELQLTEKITATLAPFSTSNKQIFIIHRDNKTIINPLALGNTHVYSGESVRHFRFEGVSLDSSFRAQLSIYPPAMRMKTDSLHLWIYSTDSALLNRPHPPFRQKLYSMTDSTYLLHLQLQPGQH